MTIVIAGDAGLNMNSLALDWLNLGRQEAATSNSWTLDSYGEIDAFTGEGFRFDTTRTLSTGAPSLADGVVTGWIQSGPSGRQFEISGFAIPAITISDWIAAYPDHAFNDAAFAGNDRILGGRGGDVLRGEAGNDTVFGGGGADFMEAGTAARRTGALANSLPQDGANYLRGDEGNDTIVGGAGFDDINGNMGNDVASGGLGDDWVVGGKDDDRLAGDGGGDIVYGNLGDDTCDGGAGNDLVRGGQDNDSLSGGSGDDWLSGDLGSDTISGGAGADVFHSFGEAGIDRVLDFNRTEGDRVQLDPGTTYSVSQVGADVVIDITGGAQMVLVAVSMASLTEGWIGAA